MFIIRKLILPGLHESYHDLSDAVRGADLLITQNLAYAAVVLAQKTGIAWTSTALHPLTFYSRHDLPVMPPLTFLKRFEHVPGVPAALMTLTKIATGRWPAPVFTLRRELGLPPGVNPMFEGQHSPQQVLALFSPVLGQAQPDWPADVRITGAIPYNAQSAEQTLPTELQSFLDAGAPPVVFTLGSAAVGAAGTFYRESIEAARLLSVRAVLLVGAHPQNLPPEALPANVHAEPFAPHALLFPSASVIVHQGGVGTVHQALRAGRPTIVVPFAHDQPDNAYRLARLGVSRTILPKRYRAERVARELGMLLGEPQYRERAAAAGVTVRAENGVAAACDAIEQRFH